MIQKHIDNNFNNSIENLSESLKFLEKLLQHLNTTRSIEALSKDSRHQVFKNVIVKLQMKFSEYQHKYTQLKTAKKAADPNQ